MASQKKAIELSPNNYDIKLEMARLYIGEQSFKQADLLLTEILEAHPDYVIAQKLSLQIKRSKLGLPNSSKIDPVAYKNALEAKKEGDYVKSEELFLQLIEKTEDSPKAWFQLGLVQKHLGKIEESLTSMSKALELAPKRNDCFCSNISFLSFFTHPFRSHDLLHFNIQSIVYLLSLYI